MSHIGELEKSKDWISGTKFCGGEKIVVSLASIIEILFLARAPRSRNRFVR